MFINFDARIKKKFENARRILREAGRAPFFKDKWMPSILDRHDPHGRVRLGKTRADKQSGKWHRRLTNRVNRANAN